MPFLAQGRHYILLLVLSSTILDKPLSPFLPPWSMAASAMSSIFSIYLHRLVIDEVDYAFCHVRVILTHLVGLSAFLENAGGIMW